MDFIGLAKWWRHCLYIFCLYLQPKIVEENLTYAELDLVKPIPDDEAKRSGTVYAQILFEEQQLWDQTYLLYFVKKERQSKKPYLWFVLSYMQRIGKGVVGGGVLIALALTFLHGSRWGVLCAPGRCCWKANSQNLDPWAGLWSRTPSQSSYNFFNPSVLVLAL